ncbi:MAG: TraB/GumN family protein [Pseudomonadota bacterium]
MIRNLICACLVILQASIAYARDDTAKCFLWEARSASATVYLMGSIHMMREDLYPLNRCYDEAFAKADTVVVELNLLAIDPNEMGQRMLTLGMFPQGETLADHLTPTTLKRLQEYLQTAGIPYDKVATLRPWFLGLTLTLQEAARHGYRSDIGVDVMYLNKAQGKKEILQLESLDSQLAALSGDSPMEQELMLAASLEDLPRLKQYMGEMVALWQRGDADGLYEMVVEPLRRYPSLGQSYRRLFDERNHAMSKKIEGYLKQKKTYLVIVGGGHMGGKDGLVKLLQAKGYAVRQVEYQRK